MTSSVMASSYEPLNDPVYMSMQMVNYFKHILTQMRKRILKKEEELSFSVIDTPNREPDPVDQGTNEEFYNQTIRLREYEDRLRQEVEAALQRIKNGTYGYCEETGKPIGIKRLFAVPYTRYSIEVQEYKDRDLLKG